MKLYVGLFATALKHRELVWNFVRRDFRGRYLGSYLGFFWNVIQPVVLVTVYTFIFSQLMQLKLGESGDTRLFAIYIFAGMVPWISFAEALARNTNCVLEHANLIKKVAFPSEILCLSQALYALVGQLFGLATLIAAAVLLTDYVPDERLGVIVLLFALQLFFMLGVGYFLAALNVFVRDTQQFMSSFMILWMLITPIFYDERYIARVAPGLMYFNPQYYLVWCYRWCIYPRAALPAESIVRGLAIYAGIGLVVLFLGYNFYMHTKHRFADEI
ncbi:MAG: ABC transporter permease [Planctomycetes bacterium]|nr:ABC transporter permease [Planctomycetota bacterium]